jgi:hypothetical protein
VAGLTLLVTAGAAMAEFKLRMSDVEAGKEAVEFNASYGFDRSVAERGEQSYTLELEHALNSWWLLELEGEAEREPGADSRTRFEDVAWENVFRLNETGKNWADLGFFAGYSRALSHRAADAISVGPLVSKAIGPTLDTLNVFITKDVGGHSSGRPRLSLAWQTRWMLGNPLLEPGFEIYSRPGPVAHFRSLQQQDHRAGPVLFGEIKAWGESSLSYELGYLFGLTRDEPQGTVKLRLEYEFHF